MKIYEYDYKNSFTTQNITQNLNFLTRHHNNYSFVFIGTDCNIGDSLGPLTGTLVDFCGNFCSFYGSLKNPITAKEVPFIAEYIKKAHPDSFIIVVDAAIGKGEDLGTIKVLSGGIQPGLGVNKNLPLIGDASIIGVMGEKTYNPTKQLTITRLSLVYEVANTIKDGILSFLKEKEQIFRKIKKA